MLKSRFFLITIIVLFLGCKSKQVYIEENGIRYSIVDYDFKDDNSLYIKFRITSDLRQTDLIKLKSDSQSDFFKKLLDINYSYSNKFTLFDQNGNKKNPIDCKFIDNYNLSPNLDFLLVFEEVSKSDVYQLEFNDFLINQGVYNLKLSKI